MYPDVTLPKEPRQVRLIEIYLYTMVTHSAQGTKAIMAHRGLLVPYCHFIQGARQVRLIEIYLYTVVYLAKEPRQLWLIEVYLYPVVTLAKEPGKYRS